MVLLDFSQETKETCVKKILKRSKWTTRSKYHDQVLMPVCETEYGYMYRNVETNVFYLENHNEVCRIPQCMGLTLKGENRFTYWFGPYAFVNGFEESNNGKYLMKMLEFKKLSPAARTKVDSILHDFCYWVQVDKEFIEVLRKRDDSQC